MIQNSFIFLPRITANKEKSIWQQGIDSWSAFQKEKSIKGITDLRKPHYNRLIDEARTHLYNENSQYFTNAVPRGETWRLYNTFKSDACFLDIETTGFYGDITVLGLYDGYNTKTFVKGETLFKEKIEEELSKYKMFITFNGASFDLPVIRRQFNIDFNVPHIDLRFAAKKIGLSGGLKSIEKEIGIKRADEVKDVTGEDAVYLWRKYKSTGNREYLNLLVQYNEEDIVNLKQLSEYVIPRLWEKTRGI
jgi:uncharacterized protein